MIEKKAVYFCDKCKNIVESLWDGKPSIKCCGESMKKLEANTVDAAQEKHVPVVERDGDKVKVKVGSVAHPMAPEHYILFVEVISGNKVYQQDFVEGDTVAEAEFIVGGDDLQVRAFCNLHGLWQA